jgi:chromosome segregation ATPase
MLSLTRIFLHNWHRFQHNLIEVEDSLYLAGHNGSGKSSVLDALQLVLVADLQKIRFNSSAQDRSTRDLDSYVRGKIGEHRFLRPGNTVAYVALEFKDSDSSSISTIGVCIEAGEARATERVHFIIPDALDTNLFVVNGRALPRRELKQALRGTRGARVFTQIGEYRDEMLNRLGGLNERFFDLFLRALTFQPIRDIREFVEQWLLEARPLEVETLQRVVERLAQLRATTEQVEIQVAALNTIADQQFEVLRLRHRHAEYTLLVARLYLTAAESRIAELELQHSALQSKLSTAATELSSLQVALAGSRNALRDAEVLLHSSDVMRRREELQKRLYQATNEVEAIQSRRKALWSDLRHEGQALREIVGSPHFERDEASVLRQLLGEVSSLDDNIPPQSSLDDSIIAAIPAVDTSLLRAGERDYKLRHEIAALRERALVLENELAELRRGGRPSYPQNVERFRDLLIPIVGERPTLLCDLLRIPDERWQNAVEAMLGQRRFNVIVLPEYFERALTALDQARANERLYDIGLLDLERAQRDGRAARENSLALQVETDLRFVRAYIDTVLGDIITCETVKDLRQHRRAVTAEVVTYSEWTARAIPPSRFQPWFIGERAQRSQITVREQELAEINARLGILTPEAAVTGRFIATLRAVRDSLPGLRQRLSAPLDERTLLEDIAECTTELNSLDLSGVRILEAEVERLRQLVERDEAAKDLMTSRLGGWQKENEQTERELQAERSNRDEREIALQEACGQHTPTVVAASMELHDQRLSQIKQASSQTAAEAPVRDKIGLLLEAIRNADVAARNFDTRAGNALQLLTQEATAYNTRFQFGAAAGDPLESRYGDELRRLSSTDLPRYREQAAAAQREAEEELREHVLHKLREQILGARVQLERINDALERLEFRGERYRFRSQPADDFREFYDLIIEATQQLASGSLYESQFYRDHRATFDRFYEILIRAPKSNAEQFEQERLIDYRRYLDYDIEITHADNRVSRLSKIVNQTSGGETQTPFYLTIAASFVQLYRIGERTGRPTMRLVAFDEAFSKMDQDRIGATLDLFQYFKLQIVTATPLERCEYLVPKICTNLVLTSVGDHVIVEPYRNYEARLEEFHAREAVGEAS